MLSKVQTLPWALTHIPQAYWETLRAAHASCVSGAPFDFDANVSTFCRYVCSRIFGR